MWHTPSFVAHMTPSISESSREIKNKKYCVSIKRYDLKKEKKKEAGQRRAMRHSNQFIVHTLPRHRQYLCKHILPYARSAAPEASEKAVSTCVTIAGAHSHTMGIRFFFSPAISTQWPRAYLLLNCSFNFPLKRFRACVVKYHSSSWLNAKNQSIRSVYVRDTIRYHVSARGCVGP